MAILRPLAQIAAEKAREALEIALSGIEQTICDDYSHILPAAEEPAKFVKCREGDLNKPIKRRFFMKSRSAGRCAGHNGGRDVYFYDD